MRAGRSRLRPATPADVEALFEIRCSVRENRLGMDELAERGITVHAVRDMLQDAGCVALVAERNGSPAGFCIAQRRTGYVFALFLRPEAEGMGIGRRLLQAVEAELFAAGHEAIWLVTGDDPGLRAYGFYLRLGWEPGEPAEHGDRTFRKRRPG